MVTSDLSDAALLCAGAPGIQKNVAKVKELLQRQTDTDADLGASWCLMNASPLAECLLLAASSLLPPQR